MKSQFIQETLQITPIIFIKCFINVNIQSKLAKFVKPFTLHVMNSFNENKNLSSKDLLSTKRYFSREIHLARKGFNLLANTLELILYKTLHKAIGQKSFSVRIVLFRKENNINVI